MLTATVRRAAEVVGPDRIWVVTGTTLVEATRAAVPELPEGRILAEPVGRNTAPCVGWAAAEIARADPDAVLAVLPSDHCIGQENAYRAVLERAIDAATKHHMVTVGVTPNRAETGYGYIEVGEAVGEGVHRARRFVEKPNRRRAEQFLAAGGFLWNSGMFFFRAETILTAMETHLPNLGSVLRRFVEAPDPTNGRAALLAEYPELPAVSIDHGVMEKVDGVAVVPGDFGWSDLGSWMSAWELASKDEASNALPEGSVTIDARGCFGRLPNGKLLALVGVEDLVVVDTEDALLVVNKENAQSVRDVVKILEQIGDERR